MTDPDNAGRRANPFVVKALRTREIKRAAILAGDTLPSDTDRAAGQPPALNNPLADMRRLALVEVDSGTHRGAVLAALERLAEAPSGAAALKLRGMLKDNPHGELRYNLDWLCAVLGHQTAVDRVIVATIRKIDTRVPVPGALKTAWALGLSRVWQHQDPGDREYTEGWVDEVVVRGLEMMRGIAHIIASFDAAVEEIEQETIANPATVEPSGDTAEGSAIEDLLQATLEDRAEVSTGGGLLERTHHDRTHMVVVPKLDAAKATGWRKEIAKSWIEWAGNLMPLVERGDVAAHRRSLVDRWPHAVDVIDTILGDLASHASVRFRPTLLVGPPGSGKSALVRAIADEVGLPCELQSFAGLHDGALMGTSAQWSSARESAPLQLIKRSGVANPAIVWDEIEKASQDRRHGAPAEALLPMLEPDQARRYRDLCLEVECDLSMVSHFATANDLDGVPVPVRDRMRVLTMPAPGWQHLGVLTRQILDRIASQRGIDPRWLAGLAEDEMQLVRDAWPGGSLRQLSRIVGVIVDGRDRIIGRA